jgi:hypothetical protein
MGVWIAVVRGAAAVNVVLLVGLCALWARNYRAFRSKHALGLLVFGVLLLAENALAMYYFTWHPELSGWFSGQMPSLPGQAMMFLRTLEAGALLFLGWTSWD